MQESEGVLCMRVSFRIALAGQVIGVSALYEQTRTFCKNYLTDAPASFEVAVTPADIAFEREKNDREAAVEGHAPGNFSDEYKYPVLLPFFWVWRLIYKGITNRKKVTQEIKTIKAGKQN